MTFIDTMLRAAEAAGPVIMDIYSGPFDTVAKSDGSPVTEADQRAEKIILEHLAGTGIPVLGEESVAAGRIPELGERFFVVDPVDGTKEFIKRNGEFTVNIALVEHGRPVAGVVTAPAMGIGYVGSGDGAFSFDIAADFSFGARRAISVGQDGPFCVVASRSHGHPALEALCERLGVQEDVSVGSSLKFCKLADGEAQLYPRLTPTCEWDTAAGQAVLEAAGGCVLQLDGTPLVYGKHDQNFLNPFFVAAMNEALARRAGEEMRQVLDSLS